MAPAAEETQTVPGQSYGERGEQDAYVAATQPQASTPAAEPAARPQIDLNEFADMFSETARPDEPIMAGVPELEREEVDALREWGPLLQEMAAREDASPALRALALKAASVFG